MTTPIMSRGEIRFLSIVVIAIGVPLVVLAVAIDWIRGSTGGFGPLQAIGLAVGVATVILGIALPRSSLVQKFVLRLWPFGSARPERPFRILVFALWLSGLVSLIELALRFVQYELGQRWSSLNPHSGWMTPLSYAVWMSLLAGVFAAFAARGWHFLGSPRLTAFALLLFAAVSSLSLYSTELHWIPIVLLSLGVAAQGSKLIASRLEGTRKLVRASARVLVFFVALAAIGPFAWRAWSEWRALAAMPDPAPRAPNVLLIILDTVRAQNLSVYGYVRKTSPNLEQLARRSTVYDDAFAPSSWTLPSHSSFFTGRPPHEQSGNYGSPLNDELPTLAEVMRDHGYYTLGVVANHDNAFPHTGLHRGFVLYDTGVASFRELLQSSSPGRLSTWFVETSGKPFLLGATRKNADTVNERFLRFVDRRGERPFFAFLNYFDAHFPFDRLPTVGSVMDPQPRIPVRVPALMQRIDSYDRTIAYIDDRLGVLFQALDQRGMLANTIVIVSSDHGEEFTEHGRTGHGWNVYHTTLWVPLLISFPPTVPEGIRVSRPVALQDLPATIVELARIEGSSPFQGHDLISFAGASASAEAPVLSELSGNPTMSVDEIPGWDQKSLVMGNLHYIKNPDNSEEIYDFENDPWELRDLAKSETGAAALRRFRTILSSLVEEEARLP